MKTYQRKSTVKRWLLRTIYSVGVLSCCYLGYTSQADYAAVLFFLLLCGSVFSFTQLTINGDGLQIRQLYAFGFLWRSWEFRRGDRVTLLPFDITISDSAGVHTDDWYDIFFIFVRGAEMTVSNYLLRYQKTSGEVGRIRLSVNPTERRLIETIFPVAP